MIVLQSQTEDCQHPTSVSFGLVPVLVPKKTSDGEFGAFDPELRSFTELKAISRRSAALTRQYGSSRFSIRHAEDLNFLAN